MEAKIIEFLYNERTNFNPEVSSYNITMLTDEYPDLWRLWYWSGWLNHIIQVKFMMLLMI